MLPSFDGTGTLLLPDGATYRGTYRVTSRNMLIFDGTGTLETTGKLLYTGAFVNGKISYGKLQYLNTGSYEGHFDAKGRPHGHGTYLSKRDYSYCGEWQHGLYHGHGRMTLKDGSYYDGEWKEGKKSRSDATVDSAEIACSGEWIRRSPRKRPPSSGEERAAKKPRTIRGT